MSKYPQVITSEILNKNSLIPDTRKESATKGITERIEFVGFLKKLLAARRTS